tara:strand:- start:2019 stop:3614 length:1596 start_codon:yes stop_codon:yes gene_type:complete
MREGRIAEAFGAEDSLRTESLESARHCAALSKPHILPPEGWDEGESLPQTFSALASRGITNLEGRLLLALFPVGQAFFKLKPAAKFKYDPDINSELLQEFENKLAIHEMVMLAKIEQDDHGGSNARRAGFRSRMRTAISQLLVTGDVLIQMTDAYQIRVHRRDNYVQRRDTGGDVLYMITREQIDPLSMAPEMLEISHPDPEALHEMSVYDRMTELYTRIDWNPVTKTWVITQECNGQQIVESEEKVTPYFTIPYSLPPGGQYGRGIIEDNLGDVRSMNELTERLLDFAAISSKHLFALDYSSQVRPQDLTLPTGSVIQAKVQGGQVSDVGILRTDRAGDFNVVQTVRESLRRDLSAAMLMEAEQLPTYERASRLHVERVAMELEGALGGVYAPIADALQIPLVERLMHLLERDGTLPPLPDDTVEVEAVTGISALSREGDQQKLMQLLQSLSQMGPDMLGRIDRGLLLEIMVRHSGVYEPGLVKSDEQVQEEQAAAAQQQQQQMLAEQLTAAGGQMVQQAASQSMEAMNG